MTSLSTWLFVSCFALGVEMPADYRLPEPPGPHVQKTAAAAPTFASGEPLIATSYFYWYDKKTNHHILNHDGADALTDHPPTLEGFSYKNVDWHARQLADMIVAGIDVAMPIYWGAPGAKYRASWSNAGLPKLVAARRRLLDQGKEPPRIGMFYDTHTLRHNREGYHANLTTPAGRLWFYGTIRDFFSLIPPRDRATIDGRPLVFLYTKAFTRGVDDKLFPTVRKWFRRDFGTDPYLVRMTDWPEGADSVYQWGGALMPQILDTAAIGPGYDHSAVPGRPSLVRTRLDGGFYRFGWEKLLALNPKTRPWLVHLETWNEFHEGTEICETKEHGRQYIELTRHYAERFHAGKQIAQPHVPPAPEVVSATPEKSVGLQLRGAADGRFEKKTVEGERVWRTAPNAVSPRNRYLYFDVDNFFLFDGDEPIEIEIEYLDAGAGAFGLEYDSADPRRTGLAERFCPGATRTLADTGDWKTLRVVVPHARFAGRANGADFRLARANGDLVVRRVAVRRPQGTAQK